MEGRGRHRLGNLVSVVIISSCVNQIFSVCVDYTKDKRYQSRPDRNQRKKTKKWKENFCLISNYFCMPV